MDIDQLNQFVAHGFLVDNIEREIDFYTETLGYEIGRQGDCFVSLANGPGGGLFLWSWAHITEHLGPEAERLIKHHSMQAIRFDSRNEVDEAYTYLKSRVSFVAPPRVWDWNAYAGYFVDNQNYLWEIWTWKN